MESCVFFFSVFQNKTKKSFYVWKREYMADGKLMLAFCCEAFILADWNKREKIHNNGIQEEHAKFNYLNIGFV